MASLELFGALSVFAFHAWLYSRTSVNAVVIGGGLGDEILSQLRVGLVLFFVLSGFLLYRPWVVAKTNHGRSPRVGAYLRRRGLRVIPAYYLAIAGAAAVLWPISDQPGVRLPPASHLPLFLVFAQNQTEATVLTLNPPTWTLAIEVAFYLVLPLLGWLALRGRASWPVVAVPLTAAVAGLVFNLALSRQDAASQTLSKSLPAMLPYFACGMLAAVASVRARPGRHGVGALLLVGSALVVGDVVVHARAHGGDLALTLRVLRNLVAAGGFALIIVAAVARPVRLLTAPPLARVGVWSYGLYLWHVPLLLLLRAAGLLPSHAGWAFVVGIGPAVLAGALSWRFVEQPAIAWNRGRAQSS